MQRPVFALTDFVSLSNTDLAAFCLNVSGKLAGNANYPDPPVTAAALAGLASSLQSKTAAAIDGGIVQKAEAKQARLDVLAALKETVRYVNATTYNNKIAIEGVGFNASASESQPAQVPGKPQLKVSQGADAGTAIIEIKGEKGLKSYTAIIYKGPAGATPVVQGRGHPRGRCYYPAGAGHARWQDGGRGSGGIVALYGGGLCRQLRRAQPAERCAGGGAAIGAS